MLSNLLNSYHKIGDHFSKKLIQKSFPNHDRHAQSPTATIGLTLKWGWLLSHAYYNTPPHVELCGKCPMTLASLIFWLLY